MEAVQAFIVRHLVQPGPRVFDGCPFVKRFIQHQEGVLYNVVGILLITHHPDRQPAQSVIVLAVKGIERAQDVDVYYLVGERYDFVTISCVYLNSIQKDCKYLKRLPKR